jgi:hypothetical protein
MADKAETVVVAGEQVTNPPSALPFKPDEQFRLVNQRLDTLADELSRVAKPAQFRLADVLNLLVIIVGFAVAGIAAFGLSERISDGRTDQAASELRIKDSVNALEIRLGTKLDKLSDQFSSMSDRTSRLEGAAGASTALPSTGTNKPR